MESKEEIVQGKMIKPLVYITIITGILAMIIAAVIKLTLFVNNNEFAWKFPLEVLTHRVLTITPREKVIVHEYSMPTYPEEIDTDYEKLIANKFGPYDAKMAIAVMYAESGGNESAFNANDNGSVDIGLFQINSVNWKIEGCSLQEIVIAEKNIDCAYTIWDRANGEVGDKKGNFRAWSSVTNGSYLAKY